IYPSIGPLVETISMRARLDHGINYGRVRLWGSVTFIGASAFTGWLLEWTPASIILICFMVTLAVNLGGAHLLPREAPPQKKRVSTRSRFADVLEIGRHPIFILFVLTSSLAQATHAVYYAFGTLAWQKQGYPDTVIGLLWATGVVAEIILFYISGPLMARLGAVKLLIIATGASVIRWTITAFSPHIALLFVVQALHALTFGAAHLGAVQFVAQAAPPRVAATAQSLYAAMASGVMMGLMTISIGPLYESIGAHTYFAMAGAGALALAGALLLAVRWNGQALVPEDEPGSEQVIEEQEVAK
ncbi:MFS transporter, partial [Parvibaculum sp.]|uniref:MFS transporter n=1 Tax=Parvibaculum sp. TaxID=2024848 RepID=UPI003C70D5F5